jgi:hypothetical protein
MVMNFRCPYGCGDLTLPIFPYKAVCMCPLFPQIKGGMYLRMKERRGQFSPLLNKPTDLLVFSQHVLKTKNKDEGFFLLPYTLDFPPLPIY